MLEHLINSKLDYLKKWNKNYISYFDKCSPYTYKTNKNVADATFKMTKIIYICIYILHIYSDIYILIISL